MTNPFLITALVLFVLLIAILILKNAQVNGFRESVKPNDRCAFFDGEDRLPGIVILVLGDMVVIDSIYGQFMRSRSEIYPI